MWKFQEHGDDEGIDFVDTWLGMEEAVRSGLAKSIGVSNFNSDQLKRLIQEATIKPVVNQIEVSVQLCLL